MDWAVVPTVCQLISPPKRHASGRLVRLVMPEAGLGHPTCCSRTGLQTNEVNFWNDFAEGKACGMEQCCRRATVGAVTLNCSFPVQAREPEGPRNAVHPDNEK